MTAEPRPIETPGVSLPLSAPNGTNDARPRGRVDRSHRITAELAAQLVAWRERGGWTRAQVAKAAGITTSYYGALERGTTAPSTIVADALGFALELGLHEAVLLQAQAVPNAGRSHPERLKRGAGRPAPTPAQTVEAMRRDLLAAIRRERPGALDLSAYDRPRM